MVEVNDEKRFNKPMVEAKSIEEVMAQVKGNPSCKRSGCHGRGYTGVIIDSKSKLPMLVLCDCSYFTETEYVRLANALTGSWKLSDELTVKEAERVIVDVSRAMGDVRVAIEDTLKEQRSFVKQFIGRHGDGQRDFITKCVDDARSKIEQEIVITGADITKQIFALKNHVDEHYVDLVDMLMNIKTENKMRMDILQYELKRFTFWGGIVWVWGKVFGKKVGSSAKG